MFVIGVACVVIEASQRETRGKLEKEGLLATGWVERATVTRERRGTRYEWDFKYRIADGRECRRAFDVSEDFAKRQLAEDKMLAPVREPVPSRLKQNYERKPGESPPAGDVQIRYLASDPMTAFVVGAEKDEWYIRYLGYALATGGLVSFWRSRRTE